MTLDFDASLELGAFSYQASFQADREIVVLFGHSGAGKSVTLQIAAGLLRPASGRVVIEGKVVVDTTAGVFVPPQERRVGYVVQDLALFPHLSVAKNIEFGMPRDIDREARLGELLRQFHLEGMAGRRPRTLSGGQQQRVALARALAMQTRTLLLDEPFSALDASLRQDLRTELLRLKSDLGLTIVFVTHDLREAHLLADRIAVFDEGHILQFGTRDEVFKRPATRRVGELTGVANMWPGRVAGRGEGFTPVDVGGVVLHGPAGPFVAGDPVDVLVRADRVILRREVGGGESNVVAATLVAEHAFGNSHTLHFATAAGGPAVEVEIASRPYEVLGVGGRSDWWLEIPQPDIHIVGPG